MNPSPLSFSPTLAAQRQWAKLAEQLEHDSSEVSASRDAMLATAVSRYVQLHGEGDTARLLYLLALKLFRAAADGVAPEEPH